jgi:hypothetical protein
VAEAVHYENSSPTLLTQESALPVELKPLEDWPIILQHLQSRISFMRSWRISWWEHWALLASYILPRRYHWLVTPNQMSRGLPINGQIVDPTGTQAMRICVSGLMSGLTSPSRPWFKLKPQSDNIEPDWEAEIWFDEVESRMYQVMSNSNFYDSVAQLDEDLVVFGTAPMLIYEDQKDIIRCYNPCAGEYFLGASSTFRVETFARMFTLTVAQIVEMFGLENCPSTIQQLWSMKGGRLETEFVIAHVIEPNFPITNGTRQINVYRPSFAWREIYWVWGQQTQAPLSIRGFRDEPFVTPRWATTSNDPYGRSPSMDVLPDIIQLQVQTNRKAEAIEKQVRPPLLASMQLKNEPSSILPGHVTYVTDLGSDKGMRPIYTVTPDIQWMSQDIAAIQDRIRRGFFNDLFLMISQANKEMTAFEVAQKQQEKLQVLGPVIERFQHEALSPIVRRVFSIMWRRGLLPEPPESIRNVALEIEYISMLALAQRAAATAGMERYATMVASFGATDPEAFDMLDRDIFLREYGNLLTVPHKIIPSPDVVVQRRELRQQQMEAAKQEAQVKEGLGAGIAGAKDLSQIDVGGGQNALQMMIGRQPL